MSSESELEEMLRREAEQHEQFMLARRAAIHSFAKRKVASYITERLAQLRQDMGLDDDDSQQPTDAGGAETPDTSQELET